MLWYPRPLIRELSPAFAQHLIRLHAHLFIHVAVMRIYLCTWPSLQAGPGQRGRAPGGRHSLNPGGHHPLWRLQRDRAGLGKQNKTKQNKTKQNKTKQFNFDSRSN